MKPKNTIVRPDILSRLPRNHPAFKIWVFYPIIKIVRKKIMNCLASDYYDTGETKCYILCPDKSFIITTSFKNKRKSSPRDFEEDDIILMSLHYNIKKIEECKNYISAMYDISTKIAIFDKKQDRYICFS